ERAVALVEAAKGDLAGAAERLDRALAVAAPLRSPSLSGSLHEARVQVAALANDHASYVFSSREVERWFRETGNAALIARLERLPVAPHPAPRWRPGVIVPPPGTESITIRDRDTHTATSAPHSGVLTGCRGAEQRHARALELLISTSQAARGYL